MDTWAKQRSNLIQDGFSLPNLPLLIDGDFILSESWAIPEYIINFYGNHELLGKDIKSKANHTMILGGIRDFSTTFSLILTS